MTKDSDLSGATSTVDTDRSVPRMVVAIGVGAILLLLLIRVAFRGAVLSP